MRRAFVGTSGYDYWTWRGSFYPPDVPRRQWLVVASRVFNSIELNGSFYGLESPAIFERWASEVPDRGFVFAIKEAVARRRGHGLERGGLVDAAEAVRYDDAELESRSSKITRWMRGGNGRAAYVYFDNDPKVHAPHNAMQLAGLLDLD